MAQALHLGFDTDIVADLYHNPTLVIDTSYGLTVGVVGYAPLYEADSRSHVELLQPSIIKTVANAGMQAHDIKRIVVGTGPAPFTGLRAGIVAARALGFANNVELLGQNILEVQSNWNRLEIANMSQFADYNEQLHAAHLTLAVNDARRKQLYYALYDEAGRVLLDMNISTAADIAQQVRNLMDSHGRLDTSSRTVIDIIGHGAQKYEQAWQDLPIGEIRDESVVHDAGAAGLAIFAASAVMNRFHGNDVSTNPLYLRRPDVTIPSSNKHILGQTAISLHIGEKIE
ncbi:tRNA (adenosine(37)-N6)-threonylcarbamoyltransferase complex dimerization subunit type 1 TsaB [Alloscardovia theropitheci]|uniref:tRNA (Adenosine(37)-N6)-threonylcarbamoyltransferase complex dimerization subunit type 1 TsaB n=1 Tax=Alloscardovia theropitheci TaxID=2496842 RepID=A0A4R0QVS2_9BIFI|nr:tRNA (adenosine(37)-N6)-threonylcarbamoyltransferase complex dimerization subunit type 1 TsaB [Alloscardovia theropitheci]TCD53550.1 tRNA (adenosine(37)-N6)-threonylcarbamoyltransferase complex dimerization subunit type 1 TsaB [Alloscardovia theropitheci]